MQFTTTELLPTDAERALLVGRVHDPAVGGPCVVAVRGDELVDLSAVEPTVATLLARPDATSIVATAPGGRSFDLHEVLEATVTDDPTRARLLSPIDLQAIKAAGVTFVESMLERVIEERAKGDPSRALEIREQLSDVVGGAISAVVPGSPEAAAVKDVLVREGLWSQYLEVGIGPDPEIFSKAQVLSSVGTGVDIGVLARSEWNNPEPEVVLVVTAAGSIVGATLGNDVNLRDFEGRSALLLTEAKDNNRSSAIGPFVRLFDDAFDLDDVRRLDVDLRIDGDDGFELRGRSSMRNISRDPADLVAHAIGPHHQYPDGLVLYTGTLFAPTQDRRSVGGGFTHERGDIVSISNDRLGTLRNRVEHAEAAAPWTDGIWSLVRNLRDRGLLGA